MAAVMSTAADSTKFAPGDRVLVASPHALAGLEVTVERYWRNGYFIVREDRFQTTVAADADKLTKIEEEEEGELPDSYLDRIDGHWYVITYVWNGPQIHALDCETCLGADDSWMDNHPGM